MSYEAAKEIFLTVCDLPPVERDARIREACGGDSKLREMVEALVAGDTDPLVNTGDGVRADLGDALLPEQGAAKEIPEQIDRYKILRKLGEGGMGIVYLAEQDAPRRQVALKVLGVGLERAEYQARLRREAETLGRLQHPGIAQVYDAGIADTPRGALPFIAMEYVEGQPLLRFAESAGLSVRGRLELFVQICEAVHHAHQKGVIHRDLKPDNILVKELSTTTAKGDAASTGRPILLDFGIARITDSDVAHTTMQTEVGALLGTLPYMSPEQMGGSSSQLDTRSDIYALGVILFQLLAERLPIDVAGNSIPEIILRVREDEPTRLGSVNASFRGDLETIVSHALEKEPERRYTSASEFGGDVRRFLTNVPILARPHSSIYQLTKLLRRNKGLAVGLLGTLMALTVGFAVSTSLYLDAKAATIEARAANVKANKEADKATAIRDFILFDMLAAASPGALGGEVRVTDVLALAAPRVDEAFADHAETAAAIRHTLGGAYGNLGDPKKAAELLERTWSEYGSILGPNDPVTLRAKYDLGRQLILNSKMKEAEEALASVAEAIAAGHPIDEIPSILVEMTLANLKAYRGDAQGLESASQILTVAEKELGELDEHVFEMRSMQIELLLESRRMGEAEALARRQVELMSQESGADSPKRIKVEFNLAKILFLSGQYGEAREMAEMQLAAMRRVYGPKHLTTLIGLADYGSILSDVEDYDGAHAAFDECLAGLDEVVGPRHPFVLQVRNNRAIAFRLQGRLDDAKRVVDQVLELRRAVLGPEHPDVAQSLDVLAFVLRTQGDFDAALESYLESESIYTAAFGPEYFATLDVRFNLASLFEDMGRFEDAETIYRDDLESMKAAYGDEHPYVADQWYQIARMCERQGRVEDSVPPARAALDLRKKVFPEGHYRVDDAGSLLGAILLELGQHEEGEALLRSSWEGYERNNKTERGLASGRFDKLLEHYENTGRPELATKMRERMR